MRGTLLYDGACGFCSTWVRRWQPVLRQHGFAVDQLQADWVGPALGRSPEELLTDVRLLMTDGRLVSGADVYLEIARCIWWARPLAYLLRLPGLNALMHAAYRWVSRNRYCVSGACRLDEPARATTSGASPNDDGARSDRA